MFVCCREGVLAVNLMVGTESVGVEDENQSHLSTFFYSPRVTKINTEPVILIRSMVSLVGW